MWAFVIALVSCVIIATIARSPSDDARRKLVSLIGQVQEADGRRYASRDHLGNTMNCVKIIKRTGSDDFIGVYHVYKDNVPRVNLAISNDLLQWTWLKEIAVHGSQPTIAVRTDQPQGYILVWEETPGNYLNFAFYMTWDDLKDGTPQKTYEVKRTLSRCTEGTPNIYGEPTVDNALLHYGVRCSTRDRDALSDFDDYAFTIIEGQYQSKSIGTWRIFVFDLQTGTADQVPIVTNGRSQAFTNHTMTLTTLNEQRILLVTLFIINEKSAPVILITTKTIYFYGKSQRGN
jgi:hypothetical protein